jgi:hypothetical protein
MKKRNDKRMVDIHTYLDSLFGETPYYCIIVSKPYDIVKINSTVKDRIDSTFTMTNIKFNKNAFIEARDIIIGLKIQADSIFNNFLHPESKLLGGAERKHDTSYQ